MERLERRLERVGVKYEDYEEQREEAVRRLAVVEEAAEEAAEQSEARRIGAGDSGFSVRKSDEKMLTDERVVESAEFLLLALREGERALKQQEQHNYAGSDAPPAPRSSESPLLLPSTRDVARWGPSELVESQRRLREEVSTIKQQLGVVRRATHASRATRHAVCVNDFEELRLALELREAEYATRSTKLMATAKRRKGGIDKRKKVIDDALDELKRAHRKHSNDTHHEGMYDDDGGQAGGRGGRRGTLDRQIEMQLEQSSKSTSKGQSKNGDIDFALVLRRHARAAAQAQKQVEAAQKQVEAQTPGNTSGSIGSPSKRGDGNVTMGMVAKLEAMEQAKVAELARVEIEGHSTLMAAQEECKAQAATQVKVMETDHEKQLQQKIGRQAEKQARAAEMADKLRREVRELERAVKSLGDREVEAEAKLIKERRSKEVQERQVEVEAQQLHDELLDVCDELQLTAAQRLAYVRKVEEQGLPTPAVMDAYQTDKRVLSAARPLLQAVARREKLQSQLALLER
jgi:hypothetical protein